jgi:sensor histidine kinase YesM
MPVKSKKFNDEIFKWVGIPATGITAFSLSAYLNIAFQKPGDYVWNLAYFIFVSFALWYGTLHISFLLHHRISKVKKILVKILLRYAVIIFCTFSISYILLQGWNKIFHHSAYQNRDLLMVQLVLTFISILVASIYETVYLNKEKETGLVRIERVEKQKIQAQLDALKSQIDPHFIFNSLNTLSYLISFDPAKAKLFNDSLAKVYRYILINKEKDMVPLKEEIEFASNNYYLLRIRYQTGLRMSIKMNDIVAENYLIPPLSLQTLIENAIKHNHFSDKVPLKISINISREDITVTNNRRIKRFEVNSSKIGLMNLNERYKLIVNKSIAIDEKPESFSVTLPLLISEHYDKSFNY